MEYVNGVSTVYIRKFKRKLEQYNKLTQLPDYFSEMIGDKKFVRIAELGAGPVNTIGTYWDTCKVEIVASDIMWPEYKKLWDEHKVHQWTPIEYQDMEKLTYPDESFDIVHVVNALDHTLYADKAIREMKRICKPGGWIYMRHAQFQRKRFGGNHYWDFEYCVWESGPIDHEVIMDSDHEQAFETIILEKLGFISHLEGDLIVSLWQKT